MLGGVVCQNGLYHEGAELVLFQQRLYNRRNVYCSHMLLLATSCRHQACLPRMRWHIWRVHSCISKRAQLEVDVISGRLVAAPRAQGARSSAQRSVCDSRRHSQLRRCSQLRRARMAARRSTVRRRWSTRCSHRAGSRSLGLRPVDQVRRPPSHTLRCATASP